MFDLEKMRAIGKMMAKQAQEKAAAEPEAANEIIDMSPLLKAWKPGTMDKPVTFARGDVRVYDSLPWWCVTAHTHHGEEGWEPGSTSALWAQYHSRDAAHALPFKAEGHNPYNTGHWCTEDGTAYECLQDGTTYPPSVLSSAWRVPI